MHSTIYDYLAYAYAIRGGPHAFHLYFRVGGHKYSSPVKHMSMPLCKFVNHLLVLHSMLVVTVGRRT